MEYEIVIGLEVHAELATQTKIFCNCTTQFGGDPNTHCCPVCLGFPGILPILNQKVVEYGVKAGLALNCTINPYSVMARKHYFYPDLPKAFQISQYDQPLCSGGYVEIGQGENRKQVRLNRIHIEEDAGKLVHEGFMTKMDANRCGVPLIEIVTEPDLRGAEEAKEFLETLRLTLLYMGVSDCRMEEGSMRCDVNISLRPLGQEEFGTRTEMKNLNSFRSVVRAIEYESARQKKLLEQGQEIVQETLHWDDATGMSSSMRSKEEANDYLYLPEPDILPVTVTEEEISAIKDTMPELPSVKKQKYAQAGLNEKEIDVLLANPVFNAFYEDVLAQNGNAKLCANWVLGGISRILNEKELDASAIPFRGSRLAALMQMEEKKEISHNMAERILNIMFDEDKEPQQIAKDHGFQMVNDDSQLRELCQKAMADNPNAVADYKAGKTKAISVLVGKVMAATKGMAPGAEVIKILTELLQQA